MPEDKITAKNVVGICLIAIVILTALAQNFHDFFVEFGWWALVLTPIWILTVVAFFALIAWLLD